MPPGQGGAPCRSGSSGGFFLASPTPTENTSRPLLVVGQFAVGRRGLLGEVVGAGQCRLRQPESAQKGTHRRRTSSLPTPALAWRASGTTAGPILIASWISDAREETLAFEIFQKWPRMSGGTSECGKSRDRPPPRAGVGLIFPAFANPEKWRASARVVSKPSTRPEPSAPARGEASDEYFFFHQFEATAPSSSLSL